MYFNRALEIIANFSRKKIRQFFPPLLLILAAASGANVTARWVGLEVCGVSLVTNAGAGYSGEPLTHEEVLEAGAEAGPRLARVIRRFLTDLADD
jgi:hypothetical protein